jgi:hypothetical protein
LKKWYDSNKLFLRGKKGEQWRKSV